MRFEERDRPLSIGRSFAWFPGAPNVAQVIPPDALRKLMLLEIDSEIEALEAELKKVRAMRAIVAGGQKRKR